LYSTTTTSTRSDIILPERRLEELLNKPSNNNKLSSLPNKDNNKEAASFGNNDLHEAVDEDNQDEWCLIDFGDDEVEASGPRKRPSFADLTTEDDNTDTQPIKKKKKNSRR
jgi:hypothetical protein